MQVAFPSFSFGGSGKTVTVVLPSRLLAAAAALQVARQKLAAGVNAWQRPAVLSVNSWLTQCWAAARYRSPDIPALLSTAQEHLLWKRLLAEDGLDVFDPNATARMASRAASLLAQWDISLAAEAWAESEDARRFRRWHTRLAEICRKEAWITRAELFRDLPKWIGKGYSEIGDTVYFHSGPPTPALHQLCAAAGKRISLKSFIQTTPKQKASAKRFESWEDEIDFSARWARARLESDPQQSVAIVVPHLAQHRALVERALKRILYPAKSYELLNTAVHQPSYSAFYVNSGSPASLEPIVSGALLLLELARERIATGDAGAILRSPWIDGAGEERDARAWADLNLRRRRELDVTFEKIQSICAGCPRLSRVLSAVRRLIQKQNRAASFSAWSEFFGALLTAMGWPGEPELSTYQQELVEVWKDSLSQLSTLSLVAESVPFEAALGELRSLLGQAGPSENFMAPIQVVDAGETEGLRFDAALLTGLSDETWPARAFPSPFIPLRLQQEHGVPESSVDKLRATRERLTASLFGMAPDVAVTWSGELAPIAERYVKKRNSAIDHWTGLAPLDSFAPVILEELEDSRAPAYQVQEGTARGGTSIIKAQSLCPFKAFAEYRLHSSTPEEGCLGLDARERGGLLHKALELVWQNIGSRDSLRSLSPDERSDIVIEAVAKAVANDRSSPFHEIVTAVEAERLTLLILDWLTIEADRQQPFEVVVVEGEGQFDLAGLPLRLRVDRVDRLKNGKVMLIDYKSGKQSVNKLRGERPDEPQLLVYAAATGHEIDGVLFAELKPRDSRPVGFTREKQFRNATSVKALGAGWPEFLAESQATVTRLAQDFLRGEAAVDPSSHACDYCGEKPLCRINELGREDAEEE